ncbi:oxygen-dependent choline dehydrogenase [Colletotrichum spaethianum]|uniref:Oxygen-dependent choline dehydrogenase n=1 Tax=Colletotrichum spaethianum TaxID=700344 RepID=A0AA37LET3_9PEZI|nr:oxygen-dependent choline dehydrogenase [Colletotrichum spaethianum]GKT47336.1 oxygen-dependent choline dehydrogenase [Colletotrichum spaethianum]
MTQVENYTTNVDENMRDRLNIHPDMSLHGTEGPIDVAYPRYFYNTSEIGLNLAGDLDTGDPTGAMVIPSSMSPTNQTRSDARTGYFDPAISRSNLHVLTGQTVTRLILGLPSSLITGGNRRIIGVDFASGPSGINRTVATNKEVILAAGAIQSPVLLQISGIGPKKVLKSLNISVQIDLPGVGNNFQDHPMAQFPFECYATQKRIVLDHLAREDVGAYELLAASWGQISIAAQKPLSRGTVHPTSPSIFDGPLLDPRYCADPFDCKIIRLGLRTVRRLMKSDAMRPLLPVVDTRFESDDYMELTAALKPLVGTEYHPSGTTSMMPEDMGGVVDAELMVYGTCNLRVIDAGIMPLIPGAHIQAAVYAVAEKAADIIKAAASGPEVCPLGLLKWPIGQNTV